MSERPGAALTLLRGQYYLGPAFAAGGMGTLHLGRAMGAGGFSRVVAIKRLFPGLAADRSFRQMLLDEARFASRIRHPNVVPMLDVVEAATDLYVVMEYVHGLSLAQILQRLDGKPIPVDVALGIAEGVLRGLHAAHEARGEDGTPLGIVHRDVSPQNILVGADGVPRLIDFGVAKAATSMQVTDPGVLKGKAGYIAPEQLSREAVTRRSDLYSSAVVLWEMLANRRLFPDADFMDRVARVKEKPAPPLATHRDVRDPALDALVLRGLARSASERFATAEAMAVALRQTRAPASTIDISKWMADCAFDELEISEERVRLLETTPTGAPLPEGEASGATTLSSSYDANPKKEPPPTGAGARARTRQGAWLWGAAAVIAAALVFFGFRIVRSSPTVPASLAAPRTTAPEPLPAETPPPAVVPPPAVSSPPAAVAPAAPLPLPAPPPSTAPSTVSSKPAHRPAKAQCDPPYTVDANGFKHYNRACF